MSSSDDNSGAQGPAPARREHFDKAIRAAVVTAVRSHMSSSKWDSLHAGHKVKHQVGCAGDDELVAARAAFAREMKDHPQFPRVTNRVFADLARRYMPRYHAMRDQGLRTVRLRARRLSVEDADEAAMILGTPVNNNDDEDEDEEPRYWRSAQDCLDTDHPKKERFNELFKKAKYKTPTAFEKMLLSDCEHLIVKRKADIRDRLCKETRESRRKCADIWGHREVWRKQSGNGEAEEKDLYWDWEYYRSFTFMIDATTFDDKPIHRNNNQRAIMLKHLVHPPETQKAPPSLKNATSIMVYNVIHPNLGVVLGPEIMYSGSSRTKQGNTTGGGQGSKHDPEFPHWYATL